MSTIAEEPKPGYLTSEFWSMNLVHALAFTATLFDLLHVHWSHGLSGVQAAVPVISLAISALLTSAYHDKRVALKMDHTAQLARTYISELETGYHDYQPIVVSAAQAVNSNAGYVSTVISAVDPAAAPVVDKLAEAATTVEADAEKVVEAWHGDMRDAPAPTPAAAPEAPATV